MISVIIPTYKNRFQLIQNLSHNLEFLSGNDIIVVNDNPEEKIAKKIREILPAAAVIEKNKNLGFGGAVNTGVNLAKNKFIMLLNDDVKLLDNSFLKALDHFKKNKDLFAVSFAQKEKDGSVVGKNIFYWKRGLFLHSKAGDLKFGPNAWAEGGACLIDRNKFLQLGGFDPVYSPFYWEDIDLSYRASQRGYKILFDPDILVEHHHKSTIGKHFSKSHIKTVAYRNQFIFIWKNSDSLQKLQHFILIPFNLFYYLLKGEKKFVTGFFQALKKFYE